MAISRDEVEVLLVEDKKFDEAATLHWLTQAGYKGIESAFTSDEARAALNRKSFDIVILDLRIPEKPETQAHESHGLDLLDDIKAEGINQLVLSAVVVANTVSRAVEQGVGFLRKEDIQSSLLDNAIQTTLSGGIVYSRTPLLLIRAMVTRLGKSKRGDPSQLSSRERQAVYLFVFKFRGREKSDEKVAEILKVKPDTAAKHRKNSMEKLDIHTAAELVSWANQNQHEFQEVKDWFKDIPEVE